MTTDKDYHSRELDDRRNLEDLVTWLEYGRESRYQAARCSKEQEEYWADQLRALLAYCRGTLLPVLELQPKPELGDWNWPALAEGLEMRLGSKEAT